MRFFVSDLHLGDGSGADDFRYTDEFLKFLDFASSNCEELIIVGDLFELWQSDLDRIFFQHHNVIKKLFAFAKEKRLIYLIGNHDHIPFVKYINSNIMLEYYDEKIGLYAEHGNQYDTFNRYKDPRLAIKNQWGRMISYVCGLAERMIHPDFDEWSAKILEKTKDEFKKVATLLKNKIPPSSAEYIKRGGDFSEYEKAAIALIEKGNKIVVFGHTHRAKMVKFANGLYVNCGAWSGSVEPTYVAIDEEHVELRNGATHSIIEKGVL